MYINNRREAKRSDYKNYYDTWDEAYNTLLAESERDLEYNTNAMNRSEKRLEAVKNLKLSKENSPGTSQ